MRALGATWRLRVVAGRDVLRRLEADPEPVVVVFWHERAIVSVPFLLRLHRKGPRLALLASRSRDGELVARMIEPWQVETVRGSSSRGGRVALRALHRAIVDRGRSPVIVPDGPRGPAHEFKAGAMILARQAKVAILPLALSPHRARRLRSWDRLFLPLPFTRVAVAVGELHRVGDLGGDRLEAERLVLERTLNDLTAEADAAVGRRFGADAEAGSATGSSAPSSGS